MAPVSSTLRQLAVLGGPPAFSAGDPVPLIYTHGNRPKGDFNVVDKILANNPNKESKGRASQQRFVAKILPGVESPVPSFRAMLQHRIGDYLNLDHEMSVICISSGTNALRAAPKSVHASVGGATGTRSFYLRPQLGRLSNQ
jgi:hypothetical protein